MFLESNLIQNFRSIFSESMAKYLTISSKFDFGIYNRVKLKFDGLMVRVESKNDSSKILISLLRWMIVDI